MAIGASQAGGTHQHHAAVHSPLSAAEHHAASKVLAKLGLSSSSHLTRTTSDSVKVGAGKATSLTASHALSHPNAASKLHGAGADKLSAGSALHSDKAALSGAKLGVSGATAASVKEHASHAAKVTTTKLTASDKTSVHVSGVAIHHITKVHGSDK